MDDQSKYNILEYFATTLLNNTEELDNDCKQVINENFWSLI